MKKAINRMFIALAVVLVSALAFSCDKKPYAELTPEQQQKEYAKFQADSIKNCTENSRLAKAAVEGAFDRIPENNGYYKKDKVTVEYDAELGCWVGTVAYHVDRNNTYYKAEKVFHVYFWQENNGYAADSQVFYKVEPAK